LAALYGYLRVTGIARHTQLSGLIGVGVNFAMYTLARWASERKVESFARPLRNSSLVLPLVLMMFEIKHWADDPHASPWGNVMMLAASGAFYTTVAMDASWKNVQYLAALFYNLALFRGWYHLNPNDVQGHLTCLGVTTIWLTEVNRDVFSRALKNNLRLIAVLLLVAGPVTSYLGAARDVVQLVNLGVVAVAVATGGILARIRLFFYAGSLMLVLDVVTFLVNQSMALAGVFERQREKILKRLRVMQEDLERWE
jgi:putative effector of murein hydrolase